MTVRAVAGQKGGVGKTTTTVSLRGLLAAWGFRAQMIDTGPHGSLTRCFGMDSDRPARTSYSKFEAAAANRVPDPMTLVCETGTADLCPLLGSTGTGGQDPAWIVLYLCRLPLTSVF